MSFTRDRFALALQRLYRAALADEPVGSVAASINDLVRVNGHSVTHVGLDAAGRPEIHCSWFLIGSEHRVDLQALYYRDYFWRDEAIPRLDGLGHGELVHKSDLYTAEEKKTSAAYNEFRCANDAQHGFFLGVHGLPECATIVSFGNSTERQGWGDDQIEMTRLLAPHLHQFARVRRAMADANALGASLAELLENRLAGIIQLDPHGRIIEANDRARHILLKRDGLRDAGGVLAAGNRAEDEELKRLLARALPRFGVHGAGSSMKVTCRKVRSPLVLEIHPVPVRGPNSLGGQVRALVLIVDPAARPRVDPGLAARLLGLSPMESRVAVAVASGQTVAGVADALDCGESTVKTYLKRVYRKLGVRKQTELVRRILALEGLSPEKGMCGSGSPVTS